MQGDEETLQAKRRENQTGRLRKVRKNSARQSKLAPPQRLRLDSQEGEGEEARHSNGEHQRNSQALPKGKRTGQRLQSETQLMELLRAPETDRVQGEMGRNTGRLRGSERSECELLDMWVENVPEWAAHPPLSEVRHINRQGCQRGEEHPREGKRSEVHSRRPARGTKGSDEGERDDDSNPPSRWREGNSGLSLKCYQNRFIIHHSRYSVMEL